MKVAIPVWQGRVSPVLDTAGRLVVVDVEDGEEQRRGEEILSESSPMARASQLAGLDVDVLLCGAISRPLENALASSGIQLVSRLCGEIEEVLAAFLDGRLLKDKLFLMPGCCGSQRQFQARGRRGGWKHRGNGRGQW